MTTNFVLHVIHDSLLEELTLLRNHFLISILELGALGKAWFS